MNAIFRASRCSPVLGILAAIGLAGCDTAGVPPDAPAFSFERAADVALPLSSPRSIAAADVDADGHLDVVAVSSDEVALGLLRGTGDGRFDAALLPVSIPSGCCFVDVAFADLDLDGDLDAVVADGNSSGGVHVLANDGAGGFAHVQTAPRSSSTAVWTVAVGDLTGDGRPDVAVNKSFGRTGLHLTQSDGRLAREQEIVGGENGLFTRMAVEIGDFDGDGDADVAHVSPGGVRISLLQGGGQSVEVVSQTDVSLPHRPWSLATSDLDGDGDLDVVGVGSFSNDLTVMANQGSGRQYDRTTTAVGTNPVDVAAGDLDGDGDADLAVADADEGVLRVFENQGTLQFALVATLPLDGPFTGGPSTAVPYTVLVEDVNEDGLLDLLVSSFYSGTLFVYLNAPGLAAGG